jgi:hypothetical protein
LKDIGGLQYFSQDIAPIAARRMGGVPEMEFEQLQNCKVC